MMSFITSLFTKDIRQRNVYILRATHIDPEPRVIKTGQWLIDSGYNVQALGWDRTYKSKTHETIHGVNIERFFAKGQYGQGFKSNIIGLIKFNIFLCIKLLFSKVSIIHACDLDTALPALLISKIKKVKFVYDIYDFYSDTHNIGKLRRFIYKLERWVIKQADMVIIPHEKRISQIGELPSNVLKKILIIYNTPEDRELQSIANGKNQIIYDLAYVGVLSPRRGIIEAAETIDHTGMKMVCAGYGKLEEVLRNISEQCEGFNFIGKVSYERALELESQATAILALYDPQIVNNKFAAPNKLCEAMMLGKPIITSDGTICADTVREENIGFIIQHGNKEDLANVLKFIRENKKIADEMGKRARVLYESKYSSDIMKNTLIAGYNKKIMGYNS